MLHQGLASGPRSSQAGRASPHGAKPPSPLSSPPPPAAMHSASAAPLSAARRTLWPAQSPAGLAARCPVPAGTAATPADSMRTHAGPYAAAAATKNGYNGYANGNGHSANGARPNGNSRSASPSSGAAPDLGLQEAVLVRDAATVRVHVVVPRCHTNLGERLVLVGDCEALGSWDAARGLPLQWCAGHMHTSTFVLPAEGQAIRAKLVLVRDEQAATWEMGLDRQLLLQAPAPAPGAAPRGPVSHDYVVICHWSHTEATTVLAREVPGEVLALEQQLSQALAELRTARTAASAGQEKLQRMAMDLSNSERTQRVGAEQLAEMQAKQSSMTADLTEAKRQAKAAAADAAAAAEAAAAAARASNVSVSEVESRVGQRYEGRMEELRQQLEGVKSQYSSEVTQLSQKLEASLSKEAEAQEMVKTLREIVQKDVARLRTELAQLVNEYISARQQLQEQAQQIEASEKLRMQQIDGLSSEIKSLITKYNSAQTTISEQQRLLEELQAGRAIAPRAGDPAVAATNLGALPEPDPQSGRDWRSDWARLRKLSASTPAASHTR